MASIFSASSVRRPDLLAVRESRLGRCFMRMTNMIPLLGTLGTIVKHVREKGWVPADVLDDVEVLCEARKPTATGVVVLNAARWTPDGRRAGAGTRPEPPRGAAPPRPRGAPRGGDRAGPVFDDYAKGPFDA